MVQGRIVNGSNKHERVEKILGQSGTRRTFEQLA